MSDFVVNKKLICAISIILGFVVLCIGEKILTDWNQICVSLAQVFIFVIPVAFWTSWISDRSTTRLISELLPICNTAQKYGIKNIYDSFPFDEDIEFKNDFIHSENLYIVMNDGKQFLSDNNELLEKRYGGNNDKRKTHIVLLDYRNEDLIQILTKKNRHDGDYYNNKIKNVIEYHLKDKPVEIYLNQFYNTMAMIVTDKYAIISLYREALGKGKVPHIVFINNGKEGEYAKIRSDVEELCKRAEKHNVLSDQDK